MPVIINFLRKESISKVIHFFNSAQSDKSQSNNRSQEEFLWLFFDGYFKPALYAVASDSITDEIIGTYAGIYIPMLSKNGEQILTIKGEDTLISLDRMIGIGKRDILKELLQTIFKKSREDNARFMWGFSSARASYIRCGFKIITQIKGSFYVIKPLQFYKNRIRQFPDLKLTKRIPLFVFSWYNYFIIKSKYNNLREYTYKKINFDEIDEGVLLSFLPENVYTTYLSKDFLRWRIEENPSPMKYGFLEFRNKMGDIVSYFIFSSNEENLFFVEQFLFSRSFQDNKKIQIMKLAFNYCRKQKAIMIRALGLSHNSLNIKDMELLSRTGFHFFSNPEESYFIFYNLSDSEINPEDIYLTRLNTQGIR